MRTLFQDLHYGLRMLRRSPGFTAVAVLTLALGIAVNTTVFSWIDAILLRPLPGAAAGEQLVAIETLAPNGNKVGTAYRDFRDYRDNLKQVSGTFASLMNAFNVGGEDHAERIWGEFVSGNFFEVLGVKPFRGRVFLPEEYGDTKSGYPVAVISHRLWLKQYQSDPNILGKTIRLNRHDLTIVGIAPPEFCGSVTGVALELWVPLVMAQQLNGQGDWLLNERWARHTNMIARLKPGVSVEQARAEAAALAGRMSQAYPKTNTRFSATVVPLWKAQSGAQSLLLAPLQILMAVCFVLLLIVGANVANLQLARTTARQKEFAIRLGLGAAPGRIARQMLTESLLLAALGTLIGLPLSFWMVDALAFLVPPVGVPFWLDIQLNRNILVFTIVICAATALVSGLVPALHAIRSNLNENLKEGGRSATSGSGMHRLRSLLVVSEVALALVALAGTGLFARSFQNARTIPLGFDTKNVLLAQVYVATFCRTPAQREQFCLRLSDRLKSVPGINGVSYGNNIPLSFGGSPVTGIRVDGYVPAKGEDMRSSTCFVAPGYFEVMRIPLLDGRDFTEQDDNKSRPVMIVNEAFVRRYFAGQNPIGRKVRVYGKDVTVVGLVKDTKVEKPNEPLRPYFYTPFRQQQGDEFWIAFFIRTAGPPSQAIGTVRREASAIDPGAGTFMGVPLEDSITAALFPQKVAASMLSVIGAICLLLAGIGLYSVMAYSVSQRVHELGIRMALGAQPRDVFGMVVRQGMLLTLVGLVVGAATALAGARVIANMLIHVSANDPVIFAGAALFLGLIALLASYLPARRATKVDPMVALRCQ